MRRWEEEKAEHEEMEAKTYPPQFDFYDLVAYFKSNINLFFIVEY